MKRIHVILFALIFTGNLNAQNTNLDYSGALKISNLTSYEEYSISTSTDTTNSTFQQTTQTALTIFHPTVAYQWITDKDNFHEIELTGLMFGNKRSETVLKNDSTNIDPTIGGMKTLTAELSLRYEYILTFNKMKESKFVPSVGFGLNPFYRQISNTPALSNEFPNSEKQVGLRAFITPRITYFVTRKFFLDLNLPLCFSEFNYTALRQANPLISADHRTTSTLNFYQFPKFVSARIGIGIKI
jgi:hypothetical protein